MKSFDLELALALYNVLHRAGARVSGLTLPELMQRWHGTGLRKRDLGEILKRSEQNGDFVVTREDGILRVHVGHFDSRKLEPQTPQDHARLVAAWDQLDGIRKRRRGGTGSGRRAKEKKQTSPRAPASR